MLFIQVLAFLEFDFGDPLAKHKNLISTLLLGEEEPNERNL